MKSKATSYIYIRLMAAILMISAISTDNTALAQSVLDRYTKERPLTVIADWEFPPYDYRDDQGNPAGYNAEITSIMFDEMSVPYKYIMQEWQQALELFHKGEADLCLATELTTAATGTYQSHASLGIYRVVVAYRKGSTPLKSFSDIKNADSIRFKKGDYGSLKIVEMGHAIDSSMFVRPQKGLNSVANGEIKYYVWGEYPTKWLIKQMGLNDIETTVLNIPPARLRFLSHDKELIKAIDDRYFRLDQTGVISKIHNKWFHPEKVADDASYSVIYIIFAVIILTIIFIVSNRILAIRLRKELKRYGEKKTIMQYALQRSKNSIVKYDLRTKKLTNIYGDFLPKEGLAYNEYINHIHPEDRQKVVNFIEKITKSQNENVEATYRWNIGTEQAPEWRILCDQSIVETDKKNKPINIISTFIDITEERLQEQKSKEFLDKYSSLFNMTLAGFALYDNKGKLLETNKRMQEIFKFKHAHDELYYNTLLFDLPIIGSRAYFKDTDTMHFCTTRRLVLERDISSKLEIKVRPIKDTNGDVVYILVTAQDISVEYNLHKKQKINDNEIKDINQKVIQHQNELRYLLEQSNMRVWRSSFDRKEVVFYKDLDNIETTISFDDFIGNTQGQENQNTATKIIGMQKDLFGSHKAVLPIKNLTTGDVNIHWYSINSITEYGNNGNATGCFGLIRDVTELIHSQEMLKEETIRANNSKHQKSVFLANMTHEIRTPLNAIVGFCDLLQAVDSPEDRKEFIRIIRNNCNMLLHLINDILDISTIDENGLSIIPRKIDFAASFNDICATLSQQIMNPDVEFIKENPYDSLTIVADQNRIEQIITNFTTNSIKHTQKGHIRVGYRIEDNGIYIYCEDTGRGIPKESCSSVFDRFVKLDDFVQGTGLGLSICKAITEACHGKIGVESDTGKGATFWFWFPCEIEQN